MGRAQVTPDNRTRTAARPAAILVALLLVASCGTPPAPTQSPLAAPTAGSPDASGEPGPTAPAPTPAPAEPVGTRQLVQQAVDRGEIDTGTALLYRAYSAFGDARLPAAFRGDPSAPEDHLVLREAAEDWSTLSVDARRALVPFMLPPAAPGSWANAPAAVAGGVALAGYVTAAATPDPCESNMLVGNNWDSVPTSDGKIRIWYKKNNAADRQQALFIRPALETAYHDFAMLLGREPPSDGTSPCFHGPDGALDIYFIERVDGAYALTVPYPQPGANSDLRPRCSETSSFIVMQSMGGPPDRGSMLHELFHAFQQAFPYKGDACSSYLWFDEGAANWGVHYADPLLDWEHRDDMLLTRPDDNFVRYSGYDNWIFDLFIQETIAAERMRTIYENFGKLDSLAAVDRAIDGFKEQYPKFAIAAWNQDPIHPNFLDWDRVPEVPLKFNPATCHGLENWGKPCSDNTWSDLEPIRLTLDGRAEQKVDVPADLSWLARFYTPAAVVDESVRYLAFDNTMAGVSTASVQAILTFADGHIGTADWSRKSTVEFCRDKPDENVTDLVIVYANLDWRGQRRLKPAKVPTLTMRNACHAPGLTGTLTWHEDSGSVGGGGRIEHHADMTINVRMKPAPPDPDVAPGGFVDAGSTYTYTGSYLQTSTNDCGLEYEWTEQGGGALTQEGALISVGLAGDQLQLAVWGPFTISGTLTIRCVNDKEPLEPGKPGDHLGIPVCSLPSGGIEGTAVANSTPRRFDFTCSNTNALGDTVSVSGVLTLVP